MGKDKLRRFAENLTFECLVQPEFEDIFHKDHPLKGRWHEDFFGNDNPVILELGCGKGEYTIALAERNPHNNYIGVDIKGARMHSGATAAKREGLTNVAFIRTSIELLERFFAPGEVADIWITFPDPQMQKVNKRLTGTRFCSMYRRVAAPGCLVRLKSDSPFLYTYTERMARENGLRIAADTADLYGEGYTTTEPWLGIRTHYEQQWLNRGLTIKYLAFCLDGDAELAEPYADDIPRDTYQSYSRGYIQMPQLLDEENKK